MSDQRVAVFGCGVQKGGTTSLDAYFREHPELSAPPRKELHFFDDERRDWERPDYRELHRHFRGDDAGRLRFEITPVYMYWEPSLARIRAYNPAARLIFLFRDPFERAWSQWCMEYARGNEALDFATALRAGDERMAALPPRAHERRVYSYLTRGYYLRQVQRALGLFARHQLLFLDSTQLRDAPEQALARVSAFLGIAPFRQVTARRENARPRCDYPCMPTEADRRFVAEQLGYDLRHFAELTGIDVSGWPTMQRVSIGAHRRAVAAAEAWSEA
ncbi:MAG: sulfotransferase domain-containing protein [Steroidobacteraceae bacterium]